MFWLIALTVLAFYFAVFYKSQSFTQNAYESGKTPFLFVILLRIFARVWRRRQGKIYGTSLNGTSKQSDGSTDGVHITPSADDVVVITNYRVTNELVTQYKAVSGENCEDKKIPLCFPECLFMKNLLLLICKPSFKVSPLGLIHIGQTVMKNGNLEQLLDGPCSLETRTTDYRIVPRGVEVDVKVRATASSGQCVWSGVATLLSRSARAQISGGVVSSSRQQADESVWDDQDRITRQQINVAADTGIKYAKVSGDWNPHHLYTWSAKLLGYRAPIAHGLWTLGRTVGLISGTLEDPSKFTEVESRFKRPLFLPGTAIVEHYTDGATIKFRVIDSKTCAPHLSGTMS